MGNAEGILSRSNDLVKLDLFDEIGLKQAITRLGWTEQDGKFYTKTNAIVKCSCCNAPIQLENLGGFFAGSVKVSCSKATCFLAMLYKYKR